MLLGLLLSIFTAAVIVVRGVVVAAVAIFVAGRRTRAMRSSKSGVRKKRRKWTE